MLDAKITGSTYLNYVSSSALMLDAKMTAAHIKLCIVFGSICISRKYDGSTYLIMYRLRL